MKRSIKFKSEKLAAEIRAGIESGKIKRDNIALRCAPALAYCFGCSLAVAAAAIAILTA